MVLDLAEMELDGRLKWFFRLFQMTGMTVEDYYARFHDWNEEMVSLSFPAEEEDYIDGFIENLSWDIRSRLSKYRSSRSRLINAFYDAKFEESMMFIEENLKEIKANRMAEGIRSELTVEKQLVQQPIEEQQVEASLSTTSFKVTVKGQGNKDPKSAMTTENPAVGVICDVKRLELAECLELEENDGSVFEKIVVQNDAHKVFVEMSEPIVEEYLLGIEGTNAAHYMLDERPKLSSYDSDEDLYDNKDSLSSFTYILEIISGDDKSNWVSGLLINLSKFSTQDVSKGLSTSENEVRIEFEKWHGKRNNQELLNYSNVYGEFMVYNHLFVDICCRYFDPRGHFLPQMDRDVLKIDDDFWLNGILTFIFDPGGCSRPHMGCGSLECNNEQEDCCWAANVAEFLIIEVPWIMCEEDDVLQPMINIRNGWYFDSYCPNNPNTPNTWIGNWTGRFKSWGGLEPLKIVGDVVFSIVKFEAASIDKAVRWLRYGCFWTIKHIRVIFIPSVFAATSELKVFDIIAQPVPEANLSASKIAAKLLKQAEDSSHVLDRMLPQLTTQSILDCHLVNDKDGKEDPRLLGLNYLSKFLSSNEEEALGMNLFELLGTYPILNGISNSAMHNRASFIMKKIHKVHQGFGSLRYGVGGTVIEVRNDPPKGNPKSGTPSVGNLFDLNSELVCIHDSTRANVLGVPAKASINEAYKDDGYSPREAWLENFVWDPGQCVISYTSLRTRMFLRGWEKI